MFAIVAFAGVIVLAADFNKALADSEGRRRAAENGLRAIKTKSPALGDAATSLVTWVAARNRALGEAELTGPAADTAKTWVHGNLTDIAAEVWQRNRTASQ